MSNNNVIISGNNSNIIISGKDSNSTVIINGEKYVNGEKVDYDKKAQLKEKILEVELKIRNLNTKLSILNDEYNSL